MRLFYTLSSAIRRNIYYYTRTHISHNTAFVRNIFLFIPCIYNTLSQNSLSRRRRSHKIVKDILLHPHIWHTYRHIHVRHNSRKIFTIIHFDLQLRKKKNRKLFFHHIPGIYFFQKRFQNLLQNSSRQPRAHTKHIHVASYLNSIFSTQFAY